MSERRKRNGAQTIHDILEAARPLFSERGLNGVSIRDIERASGVSKGLILHHFPTKENLYDKVLALQAEEYVARMSFARTSGNDLKALIAAAVRNSFRQARENGEFGRLSLWAYLEGHERATDFDKRFTEYLVNAMREGQRAGLVREDIDPLVMPFIIKGAIEYWIRKEKLIRDILGAGLETSELDSRLIEALCVLFAK